MTAKICFIYPHSIPSEKNRVIYQRLKILSSYYFVVLFTVDKYHIPVELEKMMKVMRMPCSVSHNILRKVIKALRDKKALYIEYQSLSLKTPTPKKSWISPYAFAVLYSFEISQTKG